MVGEAHHPGPFPDLLKEPRHAAGHPLYGHKFSGQDAVGEDDNVDSIETGPFTARLVAGIGVWGLILLLML